MPELAGLEGTIRIGGLHVVRVLAAVWMLPIVNPGPGSRVMRLGLGLVLGISAAIARFGDDFEDPGDDPILLTVLALQEFAFGALMGWLAGIAFEAVKVAGSIISVEMGMHMANQIDPNTNTQLPVISFLLQNLALVLFFLAGGHEIILGAFVRSFDAYPPGQFPEAASILETVFSFAVSVVTAGIKIGAPVFLLLVIVSVSVGFLAKMAPNLHVLEASFPIRILAALVMMVLFLPAMMAAFDGVLHDVGQGLLAFVEGGV